MLKKYKGQVRIRPGLLEDMITEGLKKRGMITDDSSCIFQEMQAKNIFGNQKKVRVNSVIINFTRYENPEID